MMLDWFAYGNKENKTVERLWGIDEECDIEGIKESQETKNATTPQIYLWMTWKI